MSGVTVGQCGPGLGGETLPCVPVVPLGQGQGSRWNPRGAATRGCCPWSLKHAQSVAGAQERGVAVTRAVDAGPLPRMALLWVSGEVVMWWGEGSGPEVRATHMLGVPPTPAA